MELLPVHSLLRSSIYIAHCRDEGRADALQLCAALTAQRPIRPVAIHSAATPLDACLAGIVASEAVLLVLTRNALRQPLVLIEAYWALRHAVRLIPCVVLHGDISFDFDDAGRMLHDVGSLAAELDACRPGASSELRELLGRLSVSPRACSLRHVQATLSGSLPQLVAIVHRRGTYASLSLEGNHAATTALAKELLMRLQIERATGPLTSAQTESSRLALEAAVASAAAAATAESSAIAVATAASTVASADSSAPSPPPTSAAHDTATAERLQQLADDLAAEKAARAAEAAAHAEVEARLTTAEANLTRAEARAKAAEASRAALEVAQDAARRAAKDTAANSLAGRLGNMLDGLGGSSSGSAAPAHGTTSAGDAAAAPSSRLTHARLGQPPPSQRGGQPLTRRGENKQCPVQ